MRRLTIYLAAALALAFMTVAAEAQVNPQQTQINSAAKLGKSAADDGKAGATSTAPKANDKAYDAALKNLPNKQYDPWHGVR